MRPRWSPARPDELGMKTKSVGPRASRRRTPSRPRQSPACPDEHERGEEIELPVVDATGVVPVARPRPARDAIGGVPVARPRPARDAIDGVLVARSRPARDAIDGVPVARPRPARDAIGDADDGAADARPQLLACRPRGAAGRPMRGRRLIGAPARPASHRRGTRLCPGDDRAADDLPSVPSSACAASPECSQHGRRGRREAGRPRNKGVARDKELEESKLPVWNVFEAKAKSMKSKSVP